VERVHRRSRAGHRAHDKRVSYAQTRLAALEKTLFRVVIEVADPPADLVVRLDGQPLGREALGTPLPVNPGERTIEAQAAGRQSWSRKLAVPKTPVRSASRSPRWPLWPRPWRRPRRRGAPASPPPRRTVDVTDVEQARRSRRMLALGVGGAGVVAVGVGAIFGVKAMNKNDDSKPHCQQNVCDPAGVQLNHDAKSAATASTVLFGVGLVALGAGGLAVLRARARDHHGRRDAHRGRRGPHRGRPASD
jgi:hypothetical protein